MCNCLKIVSKNASKKIMANVEEKTSVAEWLNEGVFDNVGYSVSDLESKIAMPFIVEYRRQKTNGEPEKKITRKHTFIYPTFCPFCGEKC